MEHDGTEVSFCLGLRAAAAGGATAHRGQRTRPEHARVAAGGQGEE